MAWNKQLQQHDLCFVERPILPTAPQLNKYLFRTAKIPLVSGVAIRMEGRWRVLPQQARNMPVIQCLSWQLVSKI